MTAAFDTGFSVREAMWHGLGTVLADAPKSVDEFLVSAGLTWEPEDETMFQVREELIGTEPDGALLIERSTDGFARFAVPVEGRKLIVRSDTKAVLGTPSDGYSRILNREMAEVIEAVSIESKGAIEWVTGGSAVGGSKTWALALLDEPYTVGKHADDPIFPYFAGLNSHDGSGALRVIPTSVRVVCQNTWNAAFAEGERDGRAVTIRHAGKVSDRIEQAKAVLASLRGEAEATRQLAEQLDAIHVSDELVLAFADRFIPDPDGLASAATRARRAEQRDLFVRLYKGEAGAASVATQLPLVGTAYGLYSAAVEYQDHLRPVRNADTYLSRTMFHNSQSRQIKAGALKLVRDLVDTFDGDKVTVAV